MRSAWNPALVLILLFAATAARAEEDFRFYFAFGEDCG